MTAPDKLEALRELLDEDAIIFDGLDDAVIGVGSKWTQKTVLVYDRNKIVECLMRDGMDYEDAEEYCSFNIDCLWAGEGTPIILVRPAEWSFEVGPITLKPEVEEVSVEAD
jgi:hypothetical protein